MSESRYAVLGQPVAHSKSPRIHQLFAAQTGQSLSYEAIEVAPEAFADFVRDFFAEGGGGLNITLPHKEAAHALADALSPRAELAGAVNTLMLDEQGRLYGDNTDGAGLVRDIEHNLGVTIEGRSVLLIGAGGAARGALPDLLARQPASVTLLNRTVSRARAIQADFAELAPLQVADFDSLSTDANSTAPFDLIINATSLSLDGRVPPLPPGVIGPDTFCYDMVYGDGETAFVTWARSHGAARAADGLGMLVEQAAESFFLWRGLRPDTAPVIASLRE